MKRRKIERSNTRLFHISVFLCWQVYRLCCIFQCKMFSNSRDITPTTKLFIDIYIKISTFINVLLIISTTMRQLKIQPSITSRDSASLDKYLQDIGKEWLIDALQEVELAQRIKQGDKQALEKLIKANLRFVVSVAKQYQNQWLSLPDLINEGNIWLVKAAQRFDETRGFKFISYAVRRIRQSILQAIAEQSKIVRLPLNQVGSLNKIRKMQSTLEQRFERDATAEELSNALEMDERKINILLQHQPQHTSLDLYPSDDGTWESIWDMMKSNLPATDYEMAIRESLHKEIERSLSTLSQKEADIVRMYFWLAPFPERWMSLEEIWEHLDLTRERARQIKEKAIRRMKHSSRSKILKQFFGE